MPPSRSSTARHHADWLKLVEVSGPFLSMPVMLRVFPQGLDADDIESKKRLRTARQELEEVERGRAAAAHHQWMRFVLNDTLGWPEDLVRQGQGLPPGLELRAAEHGETLRPDVALVNPPHHAAAGKARVLVQFLPRGQGLERAVEGKRWKASPATRLMELLHASGIALGLATNGEQWMLVHAPRNETATFVTFHANLFLEEPITLRAFKSLLGARRLFGVPASDTLESILDESARDQQEVTDQLGFQVRQAVEVLVQAIDRIDRERGRRLLAGVDERTLYEASVGVMMRLVFLFAAEERGLLPLPDALYAAHYAVSTLRDQLEEAASQHGEEVLERRHSGWARLLATFRAIHGGVEHDRLKLPAYGGALFAPNRWPFLEGRARGTDWRNEEADPLPIDDRTVLHLLSALQVLEMSVPGGGTEARRLSFRALDVEQIGHVYEGLLDHTAVRATEPVLGLTGAGGIEPELPVSVLASAAHDGKLVELLTEETGRSKKAIENALAAGAPDEVRLRSVCEEPAVYGAVLPFAGLLRADTAGYPVVIQEGSVFVTKGADRRTTGTHYTPRSLTEPVVQHALEPLVYDGPTEGRPADTWKLRSARELLALRVCDLAMGSGAFLAQACRFLAERLVEAWEDAEAAAGGRVVVTPEGDLATGDPAERPLPRDADERLAVARRVVAERCLYGVDVNPMAVEIAKLSLWLVTLQKEKPFTFVDHALRCGDSLLGVTSPDQIAAFHLDPEKGRALHETLFAWTSACEPALRRAIERRRELESFVVETPQDLDHKERLLRAAEEAQSAVRLVADAVVAAAIGTASRGEAAYDAELEALTPFVSAVFDSRANERGREAARAALQSRVDTLLQGGRSPRHPRRRPFHWALEFPELLSGPADSRGFDCFIGNPPFRNGSRITTDSGRDYLLAIKRHNPEAEANSDLCTYFLARSASLGRERASLSFVLTNSILSGDSARTVNSIEAAGWRRRWSEMDRPWPGHVNLHVTCMALLRTHRHVEVTDDGSEITPAPSPHPLGANAALSFKGVEFLGKGFVLAQDVGRELYAEFGSRGLVRRWINGEDAFAGVALPEKYVVDFNDMPEDAARQYGRLYDILAETVRPVRSRDNRKSRRERWWQFGERATGMRTATASCRRVMVRPFTSDTFGFVWVPAEYLFTNTAIVIVLEGDGDFGILNSSLHEAWARVHGSRFLGRDLRYTPSTCFETFPLPRQFDGRTGLQLNAARMQAMSTRRIGMAALQQLVDDATCGDLDIAVIRDALKANDEAVAAAYGLEGVSLGHGFHETRQGVRFTISDSARDAVLAHILDLNLRLHRQEVETPSEMPAVRETGSARRRAKRAPVAGQATLFGASMESSPAAAPPAAQARRRRDRK